MELKRSRLVSVIAMSMFFHAGTASMDPLVDLRELELPEPADSMSGEVLALDPSVDGILCHTEVARDFVHGNPGFRHRPSFRKAPAFCAVG
jgi:hypothetical protein